MVTWRWMAGVALVASMVAGAACGDDGSGGGGERARNRDGSGLTGELADGRDLYDRSCASCHGADLRGTNRGPSQLSEVYEPNHHPDDAYRSAVANGVAPHHWRFGPMPPIGGLSGDEVDAIIAYVRHVQEREGFEPYEP